jgi:hypothetical protein
MRASIRRITAALILLSLLCVFLVLIAISSTASAQAKPTPTPCITAMPAAPTFSPYTNGPSLATQLPTSDPCAPAAPPTRTPTPIPSATPASAPRSGEPGPRPQQCLSPETINYTLGFGSAPDRNLTGSAQFTLAPLGRYRLQLTDNVSGGQGAYWSCQNVAEGFDTTFDYLIVPNEVDPYSADGFAFVIQLDPDRHEDVNGDYKTSGTGGCELGYSQIKNGLAIEFDIFRNFAGGYCDWIADDDNHHLSIQSNGTGALSPSHDPQ